MKIFAYVASVVVSTGLLLGGGVLLVVTAPRGAPHWATALASVALALFVIGPLVIGSVTAFWNLSRSAVGRRVYRRYLVAVGALDIAAAAVFIAVEVALQSPVWVSVVVLAVAVLLMGAALVGGNAILRHNERRPRDTDRSDVPIDPELITRKFMTMAIVFGATLLLGGALVVIFGALGTADARLFLSVFALALMAAAVTGVFVSLPLNRRLRDIAGGDFEGARTLSRVVLERKTVDLAPEELAAAARYARVVAETMRFQLVYLVLLNTGLVLNQVMLLQTSTTRIFSLILIAALVVLVVVVIPLLVVRIGRARTYAREHSLPVTA